MKVHGHEKIPPRRNSKKNKHRSEENGLNLSSHNDIVSHKNTNLKKVIISPHLF